MGHFIIYFNKKAHLSYCSYSQKTEEFHKIIKWFSFWSIGYTDPISQRNDGTSLDDMSKSVCSTSVSRIPMISVSSPWHVLPERDRHCSVRYHNNRIHHPLRLSFDSMQVISIIEVIFYYYCYIRNSRKPSFIE